MSVGSAAEACCPTAKTAVTIPVEGNTGFAVVVWDTAVLLLADLLQAAAAAELGTARHQRPGGPGLEWPHRGPAQAQTADVGVGVGVAGPQAPCLGWLDWPERTRS